MARESFAHIGSGTVPFIGPWYPQLSGVFPDGRYPTAHIEGRLDVRKGTDCVVVNYADMSAFLGFRPSQITVTGTPVLLTPSPLENRRAVAFVNVGPGILYLGDTDQVSTANGFPLFLNEKISFSVQGNGKISIYAVSDGTSDTRILELA